MLLTLGRAAGDLNEDEANLLGIEGKELFSEQG